VKRFSPSHFTKSFFLDQYPLLATPATPEHFHDISPSTTSSTVRQTLAWLGLLLFLSAWADKPANEKAFNGVLKMPTSHRDNTLPPASHLEKLCCKSDIVNVPPPS
jgi:hypothetical protein